jgi:hypothetical protein
MLTSMFWTNHGLPKNEKSLVLLSSCGKKSEKNVAHEPCKQGKEKLLYNSTSSASWRRCTYIYLALPTFLDGLLRLSDSFCGFTFGCSKTSASLDPLRHALVNDTNSKSNKIKRTLK